jgi:uncharacterized damage-inducible protein DinB
MTTGVEILRGAYQASCDKLHKILDGIGEAEFFWEPVAGSWTVHRRSLSGTGETGTGETGPGQTGPGETSTRVTGPGETSTRVTGTGETSTRVTGTGEWVLDYDPTEPQPAPFTTIVWRTLHIASMNYLYWDYAFGTRSLSFDLEMPGDVTEATDWLFASHEPVLDVLADLTDTELDEVAPTHWGQQWPVHRILATVVNEQVHHGAEISLLRDLYRYRKSLQP